MRPRAFCAIAVGMVVVSASLGGLAALSSPNDAKVSFQASGPAGLKIEGSTPELKVSDQDGNVSLEVPLGKLATGIELRDRHMKEKYLEVPKYPSTTLVVPRGALKLPPAGGSIEVDAPGTLTLHGKTRPVTVHYDAKADATGFAAHGKFRVNMGEYGITVPTYLGVTVKPEVDVSASFHVAGN
jgi:polyisoprenoid-binding protein YceI